MMKDRSLFIINCFLMIQHSITLLILGPMIPEIMEEFGIGEGTAGLLLSAGSLGSVTGPLVAGFSIDRAGMKIALTAGLLAEVLFLILFGLTPLFWAAVVFNFLLVFFSGPAETSVNIIPAMIKTTNPGRIMNLVHLSFSIGAFITPVLIGLCLSSNGSWRNILFAAAIPAGTLAVIFAFSGFPAGKTRTQIHELSAGSADEKSFSISLLLKNPTLMLGTLTLFLYVGGELGFSAWSVNYLEAKLGFSKMQASFGLSLFWIGIMIGRLINSILSGRFSGMLLISFSSLLAVAAGIPFLFAASIPVVYLLMFLIGLGVAGGYPNTMVEINRRFPDNIGSATGILAFGAGLGAMIFQWLMGITAEQIGMTASMLIPFILFTLMVPVFRGAVAARS